TLAGAGIVLERMEPFPHVVEGHERGTALRALGPLFCGHAPHEASASVDQKLLARPDSLRRVTDVHDAGNAHLTRDDGAVRQDPPDLDHRPGGTREKRRI